MLLLTYVFQCPPQPTQRPGANCEYLVQLFPDYSRGPQDWRLQFCSATNARCTQGVVGGQSFVDWFVSRVKEIPTKYLTTDLPVGL